MKVTFTRTAERRYKVAVEGPGLNSSEMEPAPGYDARLPHDMAHFVVENTLGLSGGIFGQLAAGGDARTFHAADNQVRRKTARRGKRIAAANRNDAMLSEAVVAIACNAWNHRLREASPIKGISAEDIARVCAEFDAVSAVWSKLAVGESMTLTWHGGTGKAGRRATLRSSAGR